MSLPSDYGNVDSVCGGTPSYRGRQAAYLFLHTNWLPDPIVAPYLPNLQKQPPPS